MSDVHDASGPSEPLSGALFGRLPILLRDRIYASYGALMLTFTAISAASYSYLVGTALIGVGSTKIGIVGYLIGLVLGLAFVSIAGGAASFRYGVETVDAGKGALGIRGSVVLLVGVLVCTLGWANVLLAMTARGAGRLVGLGEPWIVAVGLAILCLIWLLVRRGAGWMEKVANCCAAAQVVVAVILLTILLIKYGFVKAWNTNVPSTQAYTSDPLLQVSLAVEFGFCNALGMLPYMGGLSRLVKSSRHLVGPPVLGYAVFGAFLIAVVGAFAAATTGQVDPADWIRGVAGSRLGMALFTVMLLANMGALVTQVYLAGVSVQQVRAFARLPWPAVVGLVLIPGVLVSFNTAWVIDHVMNWLAYNGVIFVGLAAVLFVDFIVLRRGRLDAGQLFAVRPGQMYWFNGGVNWAAALVVAGVTAFYFFLFNPATLQSHSAFRFVGASIPALIGGCLAYYGIMRWLVIPTGVGGYQETPTAAESVEVGL